MKKLTNDTILRASMGDPGALAEVIERYVPYMKELATTKTVAESGKECYVVSEDNKSFLVSRLVEIVMKWRPLPDEPDR